MWTYLPFLPSAVALFTLVVCMRMRKPLSTKTLWLLPAALALLSWLASVLIMHFEIGPRPGGFVLRRDVGYWFGSALMMALPFFAVAALGRYLLNGPYQPQNAKTALGVLAVVGWFLIPWLWAFGWLGGCMVTGYSSCL